MFRLTLLVLCVSVLAPNAAAQDEQAYLGQITGANVYVRSGPSQNWYPIMKLSAPARVQVVGRQGDWVSILPPKQAYSLISKLFVKAEGNVGTVTGDAVQVRAGSLLYPTERTSRQAALSKGDTVSIVGEAEEHYKIVPPKGVVVYVNAQYVKRVSADEPPPGPSSKPSSKPATKPADTAPAGPEEMPWGEKLAAAEAALAAESAKRAGQRDWGKILALYKAIETSADSAGVGQVGYRIRHLERRIKTYEKVRKLVQGTLAEQKRWADQRSEIQRQMGVRDVGHGPETSMLQLAGRLMPSGLFPGDGVWPKRWALLDRGGRVVAFIQSATGQVDMETYSGWKVRLIGTRTHDVGLSVSVVEVMHIEKLPGGEPTKAVAKPVLKPSRTFILKPPPAPKLNRNPKAKRRSPEPTTQPAPATQPASRAPAGLPIVASTPPAPSPVNAEEYK